jgi:hypothetical protein
MKFREGNEVATGGGLPQYGGQPWLTADPAALAALTIGPRAVLVAGLLEWSAPSLDDRGEPPPAG